MVLKNAADLSSQQQAELILNQSPCLRIAHDMKEEFRQIYENSKTPQSAQNQMQNGWNMRQSFTQMSARQFVNISRNLQLFY